MEELSTGTDYEGYSSSAVKDEDFMARQRRLKRERTDSRDLAALKSDDAKEGEGTGRIQNKGSSASARAGADAAKTAQSGGSTTDVASSGLTTYGLSTGNPYAVAAGVALGVVSADSKKSEQRENEAQRRRDVKKENQKQALSKLQDTANNLRRL